MLVAPWLAIAACDASTSGPSPDDQLSARIEWVRYLLDEQGMSPFEAYLCNASFSASAAQTRAGFLAAYGITLDAEWERWREFLDAR